LPAVAAVALVLLGSDAGAFNAVGHRVAGHVAETRMCPETRAALAELDPARGVPAAGTWADEIRRFAFMGDLGPWHYINIPDGMAVSNAPRPRAGDVLTGIETFAALLADREADPLERAMAYRLLVHFVADIHQPLHVGRREDAGGNRIKVRVDGRRTNLHSYWDGFELPAVTDGRSALDHAVFLLVQHAADTDIPTGGTPEDWAAESMSYREAVYAFGRPGRGGVVELERGYREKAQEIIDMRLYQAGVRIATLLDGVFCTAP
jgi:hypothetical protein